jgi:hypothetical protein
MVDSSGGDGAGASQGVTFSGPPASELVLSGWSKTVGVTGGRDGDFSIYLDLEFTDGSHEYSQTAQFATGTHDWQRAQKLIAVLKPAKFATVYVLMRGDHNGTAYFADVSLKTAKGPPGPAMLTDGAAKKQSDGRWARASNDL